jgi:hypothetical protein
MGDGRASRDRELHSSFSRVRSGEVANDRRVEDSQERYGWTAHLGPVIGRAFGGSGSPDSPLGDLSQSAVYIPVFHLLHPHAAHRSLMWIEAFAARYYTET